MAIFEDAYMQTKDVLGKDLIEKQAQIIQHGIKIYRGELLDGWYQDWCLYERERLQHQYLTMLDKLMDYCEIHHQYEEGCSMEKKYYAVIERVSIPIAR